jgi:hypothetical protein
MILGEEVGEVQQEALEIWAGDGNRCALQEELIQVAAVAVAWYKCIDRRRAATTVLFDGKKDE